MIGRTISHYRITARLGEGGMGVVYRAEDERLRRPVALKFLQPSQTDEHARRRLVREAQAASAIDHPNICAVHEIGEAPDGGLFIVMPCYEGETLQARLVRGPLPLPEAVEVGEQTARGLARAHEHGIVHRDLKPANLFLTTDGVVKILDFGLARLGGRTRLTRTGTIAGTLAYMAPEQFRGAAVDGRADLWALGAILYEMLAGEPAFRGDYEQAVMHAILDGEPTPLFRLRPDAPAALRDLIAEALVKDPAVRIGSAAEVATRLAALRAVAVPASPRGLGAAAAAGAGAASDEIASIAVLPFVNMSPDPENQHFGDGLAEDLINALVQVRGLRVAARTSAFRFRDAEVDIREIGRQLNVGAVLEGSVRRAGDRLRVTAQLITVKDGYHLWSERFDRRLDDIFAVQDEIAQAIVQKLEVELAGGRTRPLVSRATDDLEAYSTFLQARWELYKLTPEGWAKSFQLFQEAIRRDPSFVAPYAWLSMWHQSQVWWGMASPTEGMTASRAAAERALALDPHCAAALFNLSIVIWCFDRDVVGAERDLRRSIALEPGAAEPRIDLALLLASMGRSREVVAETRVALKMDPLSSLAAAWAGAALSAVDEPDEAFAVFRKGLGLDPNHWQLHLQFGLACLRNRRDEEGLAALARARELSGDASAALAGAAMALHLLGRTPEAEAMTERLRGNRAHGYVAPSFFAWIETAAGRPDAALPHLEQALAERDIWIVLNSFFGDRISLSGPEAERMLAGVGR